MILTLEMIKSRIQSKPLDTVYALNLSDLRVTNIDLITQMTKLRIFSAPLNEISSLKAFAQCTEIREIYLRGNRISDIEELSYLKDLKELRVLALAETPLAKTYGPDYRMAVLSRLPFLQQIDNNAVAQEEIRKGLAMFPQTPVAAPEDIGESKTAGEEDVIGETATPQITGAELPLPATNDTRIMGDPKIDKETQTEVESDGLEFPAQEAEDNKKTEGNQLKNTDIASCLSALAQSQSAPPQIARAAALVQNEESELIGDHVKPPNMWDGGVKKELKKIIGTLMDLLDDDDLVEIVDDIQKHLEQVEVVKKIHLRKMYEGSDASSYNKNADKIKAKSKKKKQKGNGETVDCKKKSDESSSSSESKLIEGEQKVATTKDHEITPNWRTSSKLAIKALLIPFDRKDLDDIRTMAEEKIKGREQYADEELPKGRGAKFKFRAVSNCSLN